MALAFSQGGVENSHSIDHTAGFSTVFCYFCVWSYIPAAQYALV